MTNPMDYRENFATMASVNNEAEKIRKLQAEIEQIKNPNLRASFQVPSLPSQYTEHEADDNGVQEAGALLNRTLDYVTEKVTNHEVQLAAFQGKVADRRKAEAQYQQALNQAIENGEDAPDFESEDLTAIHKEIDKLEDVIKVGARKAAAEAGYLEREYQRLYASPEFRVWADSEIERKTKDAARALALLGKALSGRDDVLGKLPNAFADVDGVPFVEVRPNNGLGFGGLDPFASPGSSLSAESAMEHLRSVTVPGDGIRKWKSDQLDEGERQNYAERAAEGVLEREEALTPAEKASRARNAAHVAQLQKNFDSGMPLAAHGGGIV